MADYANFDVAFTDVSLKFVRDHKAKIVLYASEMGVSSIAVAASVPRQTDDFQGAANQSLCGA
jgi:hypothetical protein